MISDDPPPTPTEGIVLFISDERAYEIAVSSSHEGVSGMHSFDKELGKDPTETNCFDKNGDPDFKVWDRIKLLDSDLMRTVLKFWLATWAMSLDMAHSANYRHHMTDELWFKLGGRSPTNKNADTTIGTNIIHSEFDFITVPLYQEDEWYLVDTTFTTPTDYHLSKRHV